MHDRLVGVPPSPTVLDSMSAKITDGDTLGAAFEAMQNPSFYNTALKDWVTPWTNQEQTVYADLNDYTATVIGMIRDDVPFNQVLSADLIYVGGTGVVNAAYSHTDNTHYQQLERNRVDLSNPNNLMAVAQSSLAGSALLPANTAGIVTTRQAAAAFFEAGTNRAMWRFTGMNYLCRDMEELKDITRVPDRVRQDVTRSPGGDSTIFLNACVGCHNGMDALSGAYAYYNFDEEAGRLVYTPGQVQEKYLINSNAFPLGFITTDDSWINYWRAGQNSALGWRGAESSGNGAKSMGVEIASSRAFSVCQVEKVFERVCFRPAVSMQDRTDVERIANVFEGNNYNMKRVFAEVATVCMGN